MGFQCGIVGLPNVGKSTMFNAITSAAAAAENYPFCTIQPNVEVVPVADARIDTLVKIYNSQKIVPSSITFVDIAGLVKGASKGEGKGNEFLSHIRSVDAIIHVVRCFDDPNIVHVDGSVNPQRDIEVIEMELIFKDLETLEGKISTAEKKAKSDSKVKSEVDFYKQLKEHLLGGRLARYFSFHNDDQKLWMRDLHLLTSKPVMYVCNVHEKDITVATNAYVEKVREIAKKENAVVVVISAAIEAEISQLSKEEQQAFLAELGLKESGLQQVIREGMKLLGLITYFTAGPKEIHAWTVRNGAAAPEAAGVIHSDFEKGFIRAEIMKCEDLFRLGSEVAVKEAGLLRSEGREYIMCDGDIAHFKFNV